MTLFILQLRMTKSQVDSLMRNGVIRDTWVRGHYPSLPEVASAARLAHLGLLGPLEAMWLRDADLSSVPASQLASLASRVTSSVHIRNVSGCNLTSLLGGVRSEVLYLDMQRLGDEKTQALIKALESRVERLHLGRIGEVTLDISALTMYDGSGKCRMVNFWYHTSRKYRAEVRNWAQTMSWKVLCDIHDAIYINSYGRRGPCDICGVLSCPYANH